MNAGRGDVPRPEDAAAQRSGSSLRQDLGKLAILGLAYFLAHKVAFFFPDGGKVLAAVWPAAGIGLGALLLLPRRLWPASLLTLSLAGVSANLLSGRPLYSSVGFMAANVLESLCCAWVLTRWCGERIRFTRVREVIVLAICTGPVNACTALVGSAVAAFSSTPASFWDFWFTWWVADGLGLMLVTPLLVAWAGFKAPQSGQRWPRALEGAAFLALWCTVLWLAFQPDTLAHPFVPRPYVLFLLLALAAMRFGPRMVAISMALVTAFAVTSLPVVQGPLLLGGETPTERLLQVQIFLAVLSLTGFLLAALYAERRLAEVSLRASQAHNRAIFEHSSVAIGVGSPDGRFVDANPALLDLLDYSREELLGLPLLATCHPEDEQSNAELTSMTLAGKRDSYQMERRFLRKDGRIFWGLLNVAAMRDEHGQVQFLVGVVEDITARKAAEQARAEREDLFQAMFEDNQAVMHLYDPDNGTFVDANPAACAFYGYTREEFRGMPAGRMAILPEEEARRRTAEATLHGGVFRSVHILKNGEQREVEGRTGPFRLGQKLLLLSTIQDITDRLRAEEALKETEERLRGLIDLMDEGVVLTTPEGTLKYVNPAFARMFGQESAVLMGRNYQDLLTPVCAAEQPRRREERRRGRREPYEAGFLRQDGTQILARVTPFPLFSREGTYQGSCGIIRDITEARALEETHRLRRIRRSALLRLHEMHAASRQELLDYALEQIQALTASPLGYIYAYDDTRRQFILHSWSEGVMEQCAVQNQKTVYDLDSTGVWGDAVRLRKSVLLNDFAAPNPRKKGLPEGHVPLSRFLTLPVIRAGRVVAVVGVGNKEAPYEDEDMAQLKLFTDGLWSVLERQEAQAELSAVNERFHLAVRAGRIGLWDWDLASGAMHCDAYMEKCFGLSQRDLTGTPEDWLCRVHAEDRPRVREGLEIARATGERFEQSFRVLRPDGALLHMDSLAVTYQGPEDEPLRMVGVVIDVTRQRQAEVDLRQAKAEAEAATLTKAQFLANMSHEIRTPLGGVIGAAKLLAQSKLSTDQRQLADMAVESGRALLNIVNDILDFSKIEAGRLDLRPAPFALRADLEAVAAPFRLLAGQRGLSLDLVVDLNIPDALVGDSGRLDQVLRNLLGNAVKFTKSGSITLAVATDQACPTPQSSACLCFSVRDTGIGIDPDFLPHLFESFSQADDSYGKRHSGTGLGLAISRSLMERMGGSLTVESTLGAGSVFSFNLCLPLAALDQILAETESPCPASPMARQSQPLRVLLADDNDIGRMLLERILKDAGHTAVSVANGREVLAALAREAFDLVLMDVQMPEEDGLSATQRIRQGQAGAHNALIPIIALTAYAQREDRERFLAAGMDDYVPKPVEERELSAALRRAMSLRAGRGMARGQAPGTGAQGEAAAAEDLAQGPRFDNGFLERSFGDHSDLLGDMLVQFRAVSLPEIRDNLRQALAAGNMLQARQVAHKARGTFGTVGARRAALLAQAAEKAAEHGDTETLQHSAAALLAEIIALDEHLRQGRPWPDPKSAKEGA